MRMVTIDINKNGSEVLVDADGFHGDVCKHVVTSLAGGLGRSFDGDDKPEMYAAEGVEVNV